MFAVSHAMSTMQGWNPDPFGRFEHRYFSNGTPTMLVRTGDTEERDEPGVRPETENSKTLDASRAVPSTVLRPYLYERRERRPLTWVLLGAAFVFPFVAWELLVTTVNDRLFGVAAFAIVAATLAIVIRVFRAPVLQRARLARCDSMPSTNSTEPRTRSR